jgi:hypothetical protein
VNSAAQFDFAGRTYLVINQDGSMGFSGSDLLLDITGVTGTMSVANFI